MNESGQVIPRQPRGVLDPQVVRARFSRAELLILTPMATAECRSAAAMVRMLVRDGMKYRGIEIVESESESIGESSSIEVGQENIPLGDAK
jgi:hypothetical protein